jgi:hypothetical protein
MLAILDLTGLHPIPVSQKATDADQAVPLWHLYTAIDIEVEASLELCLLALPVNPIVAHISQKANCRFCWI